MYDEEEVQSVSAQQIEQSFDDETMSDDDDVPSFPAINPTNAAPVNQQYSRIACPPHRFTPLKASWMQLYEPVVNHMKLQIRFNQRKRCVELRVSPQTTDASALSKSSDFIRAFMMGFEIKDAIALLRVEDLFIDSFELKDVKDLHGEHLSRAIGRIAGQGGKTKFTIENATRTRIVLADTHIHILGSFNAINIAKNAIVKLIMGAPPAKIFAQMHGVAARAKERF